MRCPALRFCAAAVAAVLFAPPAPAAEPSQPARLTPHPARGMDAAAAEIIARTHVPGASIAIVRDGHIAYAQAYGAARLEPSLSASPTMRYAIGSISKQFTAAALLLLQEEGKLSLDD